MTSELVRVMTLVLSPPMLLVTCLRAGEIHTAAAAGDLNRVRALLEADPTLLESKDDGGSTPLLSACAAQRAEVANFLLDKGADVTVAPDPSFYRLAAPNEHLSVGGLQVHTIPATAGGMGYLVVADGVRIFNAGFHVSDDNAANLARYRKEIDFLRPFGPVDIAILSVNSHSNSIGAAYESHLYPLDQLSPTAVYLTGANLPDQYPMCAQVLRARGIPVNYPEGGTARGERFHLLREGKRGL